MKFFNFSIFFICIILSCTSKNKKNFSQKNELKFAKNFSIIHQKNGTLLQIRNSKTKQIEKSLFCVSEKYTGEIPENSTRINVPVKNIAAFSSSFIGMIQYCKSVKSIKVTTDKKYIWNKQLLQQITLNRTTAIESENAVTPELLLGKKVQLVIFSGFGQAFQNEEKLKQIGILCIPSYDWEESESLGKAEWIKFFGVLLDKEKEANNYFNSVVKKYKQLKQVAKKAASHKKVLVGGLTGDIWYAPNGNSFLSRIIKDASLKYVFTDQKGTGSVAKSLEQIALLENSCNCWIDVPFQTKTELLKSDSRFANFTTFKNNEMYSYQRKMNYFWEMSSVNPHWLLSDYMHINSGENLNKMYFYEKL